jgi:hypothetical protein
MTETLVSVRQEITKSTVDFWLMQTSYELFVSVEQEVPAYFSVNEERSDNMKQSLSISP